MTNASDVFGMVYIAGPFFNEEQKKFIEEIETTLTSIGVKFYSPMRDGILVEMKPDDRKAHLKEIYDRNISNIILSDSIIAVIDGRDAGTMFEMGYFASLKDEEESSPLRFRNMYTITNNDFGVNVMLQGCVSAHFRNTIEIGTYAEMIANGVEEQALKAAFSPDAKKAY